jgi:putative Mn2+ efflux pump MntP
MPFVSIFLLAVGLSMDAMAVAAARGLMVPRINARHVLLVAGFFGGFQALMPLLGWALAAFIGHRMGEVITRIDHWVAFVLLGTLGAKMLWEARADDGDDDITDPVRPDPFALPVMFTLAVATSIDALAAGVTLPALGADLSVALCTIGLTTALCSALGLFIGRRFGALLGKRLDVVGGVVLIALGVKVLVEHLTR